MKRTWNGKLGIAWEAANGSVPAAKAWGVHLAVFGALLIATTALEDTSASGQTIEVRSSSINHVFPRVPREVSQQLNQFREAANEQRFDFAASVLGELLDRVGDADYFVVEPEARIATGFRSEMIRIMSAMDPRIWERYEQLRGEQARRELNDAVETGDVNKLETCARHCYFTNAGREALVLLSRMDLDQGRPLLAIRRLSSLESAANRLRFEPERSILLARTLFQIGRDTEAKRIVDRLTAEQSVGSFHLGDREVKFIDKGKLAEELVSETDPMPTKQIQTRDWLVYRGDAAAGALSVPDLNAIRWKRPLILDEKSLLDSRALAASMDTPFAPVASPLAIGSQIIARGLDNLYGVAVDNGEILWSYPPQLRRQPSSSSSSPAALNAQRLWQDGSFGRMSSDGERVFFIEYLEFAEHPTQIARARALAMIGQASEPIRPNDNALFALDVTREGAFSWMVDRIADPSEPEPIKVSFLGPPLPVEGVLYAIVEAKGLVRVVALSAETGATQWVLPLAQLDSQKMEVDPTRRFAGVSPACQHGILVCPTFAGALVAIDLTERRIKWGFQYRDAPRKIPPTPFALPGVPWNAVNSRTARWYDSDIMVAGSSVLVASDSDDLVCLDIETGAQRWTRRRGDTMYVAVVGDDRLLLVGEHRLAAIRVHDGSYAWPDAEFVAIPGGGFPAGRGVFDGLRFYLPTTDPELIQINVADGAIEKRHRTDEPLGNLIVTDKRFISQNESKLIALAASDMLATAANRPLPEILDVQSRSPAELVGLLEGNDYAQRESASQELLRRDQAAIPFLASGAQSRESEVSFRCASVLVCLLDAADRQTVELARTALLAASSSQPRHRFPAVAIEREMHLRGAKSMLALQQLGATVTPDGKSLKLPPTWRGGNEGLTHLYWLAQMETVELRHSSVDDSGISHLRGLQNLKSLNLNRTMVSSAGLRHLVGLPKLETLLLQGTAIDDSAIEHLSRLTQLKAANLTNTRLSATEVQRLRQLLPQAKILF